MELNGKGLVERSQARVEGETALGFRATTDAEMVLIDAPER
jgi:hypothetical protein